MMICRGHTLHELLNVYPISTLKMMMEAAGHNNREDVGIDTQGMVTAVLHGFDCAFNKGKGKIFPKFMKSLFKKAPTKEKSKDIGDVEDKLFSLFAPRKK